MRSGAGATESLTLSRTRFGILPRVSLWLATTLFGAIAAVLMLAPLFGLAVLGEPGLTAIGANPAWVAACLRTLLVAEAAVPIALLLGVAASLGLWQAPLAARRLILGVALLPLLAPAQWSAEGLRLAADDSGLQGAHLAALIAAHASPAASVVLLVMCAFLNRLDPALLRSAQAAAAGPLQAWRLTVLPNLAVPVLVAGSAAFATTISLAIADTVLAPRHHPTLGALLVPAIVSGDTQAAPAALILAFLALLPLCLLGCLALLRHPARR